MRFVIRGRDGIFRQTIHRIETFAEQVCEAREQNLDKDFEKWYQLWKMSGKRLIDKRFQQDLKTPLAELEIPAILKVKRNL